MSEAKACPTCSSEFRDIPSPAYCRDKWHDAPPQPASTGVCSRHQHGEDPTCQICFPVQPAPAGFDAKEMALRSLVYGGLSQCDCAYTKPLSQCASCREKRADVIRAAHAKEVEEACRSHVECEQVASADYARGIEDGRAAGKREMAREAAEYARSPEAMANVLTFTEFVEWFEARAGEEKA